VIVVDASALSAILLREEGWKNLAPYITSAVAPDHVVKEVANTIWKAMRAGMLAEQDAQKAFDLLLCMINRNLALEPETEHLGKAFEISVTHGVTVYDALYIALALEKNLPLLTLDKVQRKIAEKMGVQVKP